MHLSRNRTNPVDYCRPLLVLRMFDILSHEYIEWVIDVDGKTNLYVDEDNTPTKLLLYLCDVFLAKGKPVTHFGIHLGSFQDPTHILRCGRLFALMEVMETDDSDVDHFVAKTRLPIYFDGT